MSVEDVQAALDEVEAGVAKVRAALALVAEAPPVVTAAESVVANADAPMPGVVADPAAGADTETGVTVDPTAPRAYNPGAAEDTGA